MISTKAALLVAAGYYNLDAYTAAGDADSPIAHWPLNETSGTNADDRVGGFAGTVVGGANVTLGSVGKINTSFTFNDTSGSRVSTPNNATLRPAAFTLEALVYPTATSTQSARLLTLGNNEAWIAMSSARALIVSFAAVGGTNPQFTVPDGALLLPLNAWSHVMGAYSPADGFKAWVNGVASTAAPSETKVILYTSSGGSIGNAQAGDAGFGFKGSIDEAKAFSAVLSDARNQAHYDALPA